MRVVQSVRSLTPFADIRWTVAPGLVWHRWPDCDEWVVFHAASGDVHLLSSAAAALLRALEAEPATLVSLIDALDFRGPEGEPGDLRIHLSETIAAFDRAGLIEPVRP